MSVINENSISLEFRNLPQKEKERFIEQYGNRLCSVCSRGSCTRCFVSELRSYILDTKMDWTMK